jgi:hypothetical protein
MTGRSRVQHCMFDAALRCSWCPGSAPMPKILGLYALPPAATAAGWPSNSQIEADVAAWFEAKTLEEEKTIARRLNKTALDFVVYAPLGLFLQHQAWRKNVTGIVKGPMPFFWGGEQDRLTNAEKAAAGAGAADLLCNARVRCCAGFRTPAPMMPTTRSGGRRPKSAKARNRGGRR